LRQLDFFKLKFSDRDDGEPLDGQLDREENSNVVLHCIIDDGGTDFMMPVLIYDIYAGEYRDIMVKYSNTLQVIFEHYAEQLALPVPLIRCCSDYSGSPDPPSDPVLDLNRHPAKCGPQTLW
jgi:hypothetical protein